GFMSATDFHLYSSCGKLGTPLTGVNTDIEGNTRNNPPTIGAYEYLGINNIAVEKILSPLASGVTVGAQDLVVQVRNVGTNPVTSFNISYTVNNSSPIVQPWTGTLAPCDTVSVTFTAGKQIILSNKNKVAVYTDHPNQAGDSYTNNDSLTAGFYTAL